MIFTSNLSHYPAWLREYISNPKFSRTELEENEKALKTICERSRVIAVDRVLFYVVLELIRTHIRLHDAEKRMDRMQRQIDNLKGD